MVDGFVSFLIKNFGNDKKTDLQNYYYVALVLHVRSLHNPNIFILILDYTSYTRPLLASFPHKIQNRRQSMFQVFEYITFKIIYNEDSVSFGFDTAKHFAAITRTYLRFFTSTSRILILGHLSLWVGSVRIIAFTLHF